MWERGVELPSRLLLLCRLSLGVRRLMISGWYSLAKGPERGAEQSPTRQQKKATRDLTGQPKCRPATLLRRSRLTGEANGASSRCTARRLRHDTRRHWARPAASRRFSAMIRNGSTTRCRDCVGAWSAFHSIAEVRTPIAYESFVPISEEIAALRSQHGPSSHCIVTHRSSASCSFSACADRQAGPLETIGCARHPLSRTDTNARSGQSFAVCSSAHWFSGRYTSASSRSFATLPRWRSTNRRRALGVVRLYPSGGDD